MDIKDGASLRLKSKTTEYDMVAVTPAIAEKWLGTQVRNRNVQEHSMMTYRSDMIAGRWEFAGDPIRFDREGHLIDGQNRLTALAGIDNDALALTFLVIRGLDPESQMVMDQGARRTAGQQLGLKGIASGSAVAAGARLALSWERGLLFVNRWDGPNLVTNTEITAWVDDNPETVRIATDRLTAVRQIGLRPSAGLGFVIRLGLDLQEETKEFVTEMHELSNLPAGSPTLALAKRLARVRQDNDLRLSEIDQLGFLVYTWNNWVRGRSAQRLQRPKGGWTAENFPTPDGV